MKIPKYVERLIKRRERLAWELMDVGSDLNNWLEKKQYIDRYSLYSNWLYDILPAAWLVREDILNKE